MAENTAPTAGFTVQGNPLPKGGTIRVSGAEPALLSSGNLVLADLGFVRIVTPAGAVTSVAVSGSARVANVAVLAGDKIVATWVDAGDVKAQSMDANGALIGGVFTVNSATAGNQIGPIVAALGNGGFIVSWTDGSGGSGGATGDFSGTAVKAQAYDAAGAQVGGEILVNTSVANAQALRAVEVLSNGNVLIAWNDSSQSNGSGVLGPSIDVRGQILTPAGIPVGAEFLLNENATGTQQLTGISALPGGGFAAIWRVDTTGMSTDDIGLRVFDNGGAPVGGDTLANMTTAGWQSNSRIDTLSNGNIVVTWVSGLTNICAQVFSPTGTKIGDELAVGSSGSTVLVPAVAALVNGGFTVVWGGDGLIKSKAYDSSGGSASDIVTIDSFDIATYAIGTSDGGFIAASGNSVQFYGQRGYQAYAQAPFDLKGKLVVGDADGGAGVETVTLSVSYGTLHLEAGTSGATVSGNDTASVTINGTVAQINALLAGDGTSVVRYVAGSASAPGSAILTLMINDNGSTGDGGPRTGSASKAITVVVDAAPVVTTSGGSADFAESANLAHVPVKVDPGILVSDADHVTLTSAKVSIGQGFVAGQDILALSGSNGAITASYDSATGVLSLTSSSPSTVAQWRTALGNVTYVNASDAPSTGARRIDFTVNDGVVDSTAASRSVTITTANDAPLLDLNGSDAGANGAASYRLHAGPTAIVPLATVTDADSPNLADGRLAVSYLNGDSTTNLLSIIAGGAIGVSGRVITYNGAQIATFSDGNGLDPLLVDFNAATNSAAAASLLRAIGYSNSNPTVGADVTVRFTLSDGDGGTSATAYSVVSIISAKGGLAPPTLWTAQKPTDGQPWYVGDFDGDGKGDLFRIVTGQSGADMHLSTGSQFAAGGSWTPAGEGSDGRWHVGDFDGDGKDDIFRYLTGIGVDVFTSNGSGFFRSGPWTGAGAGSDDRWYVGDFNGDGKADLFRNIWGVGVDVFTSTGSSFVHSGAWTGAGSGSDGRWYVGDFNGDGKDDLFRHLSGTGGEVFLSTGSAFAYAGKWTGAGAGSDDRWYVGDATGDGKDDIIRYIADNSGADVFVSGGAAFDQNARWTTTEPGTGGWLLSDFNGDGTVDLGRIVAGGTEVLL